MYYGSTFRIFHEGELYSYLRQREVTIRETIYNANEDYILNVNETEYIDHLYDELSLEPINFDFENAYAEQVEKNVQVNDRFYGNSTQRKLVYVYHIPFTGTHELLKLQPSTFTVWTEKIQTNNNEIIFEIIDYYSNVDQINSEYNRKVQYLQGNANNSMKDVQLFNVALKGKIKSQFTTRKQELLNRRKQMSALSVPIKKSTEVPKTFSIPAPQMKKKIRTAPSVQERGFQPEPALPEHTYQDILKIIHDMGKEFERKPSVYNGKEEEHLRDHFLMMLEPNFEGSATGETFNKKGKTDILLRHENTNVFIGECKFWKGKKVFIDTISQLLSYLTWRDSKAAVIMFVKNKEFTNVIETVKEETPNHPNYLGFVNEKDHSWLNYRFHINGDKNREVKVAIMLYHIPDLN
ncbi:hypothetical protein [Litchfieldia alkalitelluris]|uniref:hypothetical protein n=1 Tax=Litchfieldia alkalitelluris TaxID=304268 RepID=UPI000998E32E|nr:hypothetical protein [Litchfieldia alkalitelluris]